MISELGNFLHNAMDEVEHTSEMNSFYHRFTAIKELVSIAKPWLPESYFSTRFVYGLRQDYQPFVLRFHPITVIAAYRVAKIYEECIGTDFQMQQRELGPKNPDLRQQSPMIAEWGKFIHDALDKIEHNSSVEAFYQRFEAVRNLLLEAQPWLTEEYFASRFIYGLQEEFQVFVIRFNPITVTAAYQLACIYEESIYLHYFPEPPIQNDDFSLESNIVVDSAASDQGEGDTIDSIVVEDTISHQNVDIPDFSTVLADHQSDNITATHPNGNHISTAYKNHNSATVGSLNISVSEVNHIGSHVTYIQLNVIRHVHEGEESTRTSPGPETTYENELALPMLALKEPKVHPPDDALIPVNSSLYSQLVHITLSLEPLLEDVGALAMDLRVCRTEHNVVDLEQGCYRMYICPSGLQTARNLLCGHCQASRASDLSGSALSSMALQRYDFKVELLFRKEVLLYLLTILPATPQVQHVAVVLPPTLVDSDSNSCTHGLEHAANISVLPHYIYNWISCCANFRTNLHIFYYPDNCNPSQNLKLHNHRSPTVYPSQSVTLVWLIAWTVGSFRISCCSTLHSDLILMMLSPSHYPPCPLQCALQCPLPWQVFNRIRDYIVLCGYKLNANSLPALVIVTFKPLLWLYAPVSCDIGTLHWYIRISGNIIWKIAWKSLSTDYYTQGDDSLGHVTCCCSRELLSVRMFGWVTRGSFSHTHSWVVGSLKFKWRPMQGALQCQMDSMVQQQFLYVFALQPGYYFITALEGIQALLITEVIWVGHLGWGVYEATSHLVVDIQSLHLFTFTDGPHMAVSGMVFVRAVLVVALSIYGVYPTYYGLIYGTTVRGIIWVVLVRDQGFTAWHYSPQKSSSLLLLQRILHRLTAESWWAAIHSLMACFYVRFDVSEWQTSIKRLFSFKAEHNQANIVLVTLPWLLSSQQGRKEQVYTSEFSFSNLVDEHRYSRTILASWMIRVYSSCNSAILFTSLSCNTSVGNSHAFQTAIQLSRVTWEYFTQYVQSCIPNCYSVTNGVANVVVTPQTPKTSCTSPNSGE